MNAIDRLAQLCEERKLAWSIESGEHRGTYLAKVYVAWPIVFACSGGQTPYAAAKAAVKTVESRGVGA